MADVLDTLYNWLSFLPLSLIHIYMHHSVAYVAKGVIKGRRFRNLKVRKRIGFLVEKSVEGIQLSSGIFQK